MNKILFSLTLILVIPSISISQSTVGFSDTDDIQSLLDYRLPDWGYSNFFLALSFNGFNNRTDVRHQLIFEKIDQQVSIWLRDTIFYMNLNSRYSISGSMHF